MPKRTPESYKQRLLAKEKELLTGITRIQSDGRKSDIVGAQDMADQADSCYNKESLFQQSSSAWDLLVLVRAALRREETGGFGVCGGCGGHAGRSQREAEARGGD